MQKIVDQINQIFTQLDKRLKVLEESVDKPVARKTTKTEKSA